MAVSSTTNGAPAKETDALLSANGSSTNGHSSSSSSNPRTSGHPVILQVVLVVAAVALAAFLGWQASANRFFEQTKNGPYVNQNAVTLPDDFPMPAGVNLGSWLSLEDYFFAGNNAAEVATPFGETQAACLPPLIQDHVWESETDLLANLTESLGLVQALQAFHAHRVEFLDWDRDLSTMASLGIKNVRLPLSWCMTDKDFDHLTEANAHEYVCADPFFDGVQWPAISKPFLQRFLRACAEHGIQATLDMHTYPGATSIGTFSGLWPQWPRFWLHDDPSNPQKDVGRQTLQSMIEWIESLAESDPMALKGIGALSPMNEPAHLAGIFEAGSPQAYLPPLPEKLAQQYLQDLDSELPDGIHLRVLLWLQDAVQAFRQSTLSSLGVDLHVNIIESIFSWSLPAPEEFHDEDSPGVLIWIASWWAHATTSSERASWAVLDVHHYHAWFSECQGSMAGPASGSAYTCGDKEQAEKVLAKCTAWASKYRRAMDDAGLDHSRLASAEFSVSTHHTLRLACGNNLSTLLTSYLDQVNAAKDNDIDLYYWSWKMPYGGAYRSEWSFSHFLYLLGILDRPDEPLFACGKLGQ